MIANGYFPPPPSEQGHPASAAPPPPPAPPPPLPPAGSRKPSVQKRPHKPPAPSSSRKNGHASQSKGSTGAGSAAQDNQLKRETPFIATIRFKNDLPEVPCDPKMVVAPFHPESLSAFKLAQMEKALCPDMLVSLDPACVSFIDIQRFRVPPGAPAPIDPADAPLLLDSSNKGKAGTGKDAHSWLLKTRWMQAHDDVDHIRASGAPESSAVAQEELTRDSVIAHIEDMFRAAKRPPVHPKNPNLVPVEVMPILPNLDCWTHDYATTVCDSEMITHVDFPKMGKRQRHFLKEHALMKPYTYPDRDTSIEFIAHVVPRDAPPEQDLEAAGDAVTHPEPVEGEYVWNREFSYRKDKADRAGDEAVTCAFMLSGKQATYVKVNHAFQLGKRRRKDMLQVPYPEKITVFNRDATPEEAAKHRSKMNALFDVEDAQVPDKARGDGVADIGHASDSKQRTREDDLFSDDEEEAT